MKGFLKFLAAISAIFTGMIGALAIYDRIKNKNRLKGTYLECESPDGEAEI